MRVELAHRWDLTTREAKELQLELRDRLVLAPPPGLRVRHVGGADLSMSRFSSRGFGGIVVLDAESLEPVAREGIETRLGFPYVPGLLSFRELPPLAAVWERLTVAPDVLIFDGQGLAHPRRFGLACHGGVLFGVPSIGCAKSLLVGTHGVLGMERGSTAPLVDKDEVVGMAVRTRTGVKPLYVSPGHMMDLDTAVQIVLTVTRRYREPETTRQAHRLVNELRRASAG
jgi:deoxyribonuclease V